MHRHIYKSLGEKKGLTVGFPSSVPPIRGCIMWVPSFSLCLGLNLTSLLPKGLPVKLLSFEPPKAKR